MVALSVLMGCPPRCLLQRHICWRLRVAAEVSQRIQARNRGSPDGGHPWAAVSVKPIPSFIATVELSPSAHHMAAPPGCGAAGTTAGKCLSLEGQCPEPLCSAETASAGDVASCCWEEHKTGGAAPAVLVAPGASWVWASGGRAAAPASPNHKPCSCSVTCRQQAGSSFSSHQLCKDGASCSAEGMAWHAPTVIVMPDGQEVALALPEEVEHASGWRSG